MAFRYYSAKLEEGPRPPWRAEVRVFSWRGSEAANHPRGKDYSRIGAMGSCGGKEGERSNATKTCGSLGKVMVLKGRTPRRTGEGF